MRSNKITIDAPHITRGLVFLTFGVIAGSALLSFTFFQVKENKNFREISRSVVEGGVRGISDNLETIENFSEVIGKRLGGGLYAGFFGRK
jgi:hypothetical protein